MSWPRFTGRPTGPALAGGLQPAFGGGKLRALGYNPSLTGEASIVYQALLNAGATPEYALAVTRQGSARSNKIIANLSEGQIYQILGRHLSPSQLLDALNAPTGGILGDIIGGTLIALGTVLDVVGAAFGAPILGVPLQAAGVGELASSNAQQVARRGEPAPRNQIDLTPALLSGAGQLLRKYGPQIGQAVQNLIQPGPGPDGTPQPGMTPQGVPILDQTTDCPTCGSGPAPQPGEGELPPSPSLDLTSQPGSSPTLQPPPSQPSDFSLPPPDAGEIYPPTYQLDYPAPQPNDNPGNVPLLLNQPGQQPGNVPLIINQTIPQQIQQLRDQLGQEIQTEQQQLINQRGQQQQLHDIAQKVNQLRDLEKQPADQRDIPNELAQKRQLLRDLDNLQNGQPVLNLPEQPGKAPELPPATPPGPQGYQPQIQRGPGPQPQVTPPPQPVQFCVGCQSQEDAILFLNGEPSACSVVPGSTQTL